MPGTKGFSVVELSGPGVPEGMPEQVSVLVKGSTVTIRPRRNQTVLATVGGVTGVRTVARRTWELSFDNGDVWRLHKPKNCGCGGG